MRSLSCQSVPVLKLYFALGLKVLHDAQYVHRDISASNLLLCQTDEGPVCKITDLESAQPQVDLNTETAVRTHQNFSEYSLSH